MVRIRDLAMDEYDGGHRPVTFHSVELGPVDLDAVMTEPSSGWRAETSADRQMLSTLGSATVGTPRRSGAF